MTAQNGQPSSNKKKPLSGSKNNDENRRHGNKNIARRRGNHVTRSRKFAQVRKVSPIRAQQALRERNRFILPLDPMRWNREHVTVWLRILSYRHNFEVNYKMFVMNGKGICLMSLEGFKYRCPTGGQILYSDLRNKIFTKILMTSHCEGDI